MTWHAQGPPPRTDAEVIETLAGGLLDLIRELDVAQRLIVAMAAGVPRDRLGEKERDMLARLVGRR